MVPARTFVPPDDDAPPMPLCAVFRRHLKSLGLKYTSERAGILDAIIARDSAFEVDSLLEEFRARGVRVSKATVYRTIKLLQDAGIITQVLLDPRQAHYQVTYGKAPRDHMVCVRTGRVVEFTDPELLAIRDRICRRHGWEPVAHRFQVFAESPDD